MNIDHENETDNVILFTKIPFSKAQFPKKDGIMLLAGQAPSFAEKMGVDYSKAGDRHVLSMCTLKYLNEAISLLRFAVDKGKEGVEISVDDVRKFWFEKPFRSNILQWIREKHSNELISDYSLMCSFKTWATSSRDREWINGRIPIVVSNTFPYEALPDEARASYDFFVDSWLVPKSASNAAPDSDEAPHAGFLRFFCGLLACARERIERLTGFR